MRSNIYNTRRIGNAEHVSVSVPCDCETDELLNVNSYIRRDGAVDEIRLVNVLGRVPPQHFPQLIFDLKRKLKSGGRLVVVQTVAEKVIRQWVDGDLPFRAMRATLLRQAEQLRERPNDTLMQFWSEEELERELIALGLDVTTFDAGSWSLDFVDEVFPEISDPHLGFPILNLGIVATKPTIPKIIHQTWKTAEIPGDIFPEWWIDSWKNVEGYQYRFWSDEENRQLISDQYEWFLPTYDSYDVPIKRVDAARYFILVTCGGLYVDLDFIRLRNLDSTIYRNDIFLCYEKNGIVGNAFMGSAPDHPLINEAINRLEANATKHVLQATGPSFLTSVVADSPYEEEIRDAELVYPYVWNHPMKKQYASLEIEGLRETFPFSIAVTHWTGSWK